MNRPITPQWVLSKRALFPALGDRPHPRTGKQIVYLDWGATAQKPLSVIESEFGYYKDYAANVHRGVYAWSEQATEAYEGARAKAAAFIGVPETEIVWTRGTTEAINLLAQGLCEKKVRRGDTILATRMDHHANFVPWQQLAKRTGATFEIAELTPDGRIDLELWQRALLQKPKVVALPWMSNVLGTWNDVVALARQAREVGALVVLDAAQGVCHRRLPKEILDHVDAVAFSMHKLFGPTGVGLLWARPTLLEEMDPVQFGGDMIRQVGDRETQFNQVPWKFEAGTPNIAGVIASGAAFDFLSQMSASGELKLAEDYEAELTRYVWARLSALPGIKLFGPAPEFRGPVFSFELKGVHAHDLATALDLDGVCVRAGHHCAQPLMRSLSCSSASRASFSFLSTVEEADALIAALQSAATYFGGGR